MINIKKLTENLKDMRARRFLLEDTFRDMASGVDTGRKSRATPIPAYFQYVDQSKDGTARSVWYTPSASNPNKKYQQVVEIKVPIEGGLFNVAGGKWKPKEFSQALAKSDVRVHCTCPDFYWSGMKYNLGPGGPRKGSLAHNQTSDVSEEQYPIKPPDIRDPERKNTMCKHLYSVWQVFPMNAFSIMKSAFDYAKNNEINTIDEKVTRDLDNGKASLEKDVEGVSVTEGDAQFARDALIKGAEAFELAQSQGSKDIIDEENESTIDTTEEDIQNQGIDEIIDEKNQEVSDPVEEEIIDIKSQGAEDIIDDKNATVIDNPELEVNEIISEKDIDETSDDELDEEDFSASDILSR